MRVGYASDPAYVWRVHDEVSGDVAFDVGANGGMTARLYAPHFGHVVAFEPCAESFADLNAERPRNVTAVPCAVSDTNSPVVFDVRQVTAKLGELTTGDTMVGHWGERTGTRVVDAITLDAAARRWGQPDFIKVDTEGHEARVVGGGDLIFEARPRLFIEMHDVANLRPILERLQPFYRELRLCLHDDYRPDDPLRAHHFYLLAGV